MPAETVHNLLKSGSTEYQEMISDWNLIDSIFKGSIVIDKNPKNYLKQYIAERDKAFEKRAESAVFDNYFSRAIRDISGLPFSEPITIPQAYQEDEYFKEFFLNVDGQGNDLTSFFKNVFDISLGFGLSCVVVNFFKNSDDIGDNYPVFKFFKPQNVKGAWGKYVGKNFVLTRLWLRTESITVSTQQETIREEITEFKLNEETNKVEVLTFVESGSGYVQQEAEPTVIDIDTIPAKLYKISSINEGVLKTYPVLYDLMRKNFLYYNKKSDHDNIIKVANFPILYAKAVENQEEVDQLSILGPDSVLYSGNPNAQFGYVEHSGQTIKLGGENLKEEEDKMLKFAPEFQNRISTHPTARQVDSEDKKSGSYIRHLALNLDNVINDCFEIIAKYRKRPVNPDDLDFQIFKDFTVQTEVRTKMEILIKLRALGDVSRETVLERARHYQLLGKDFKVEDELERIATEVGASPPFDNEGEGDEPIEDGNNDGSEGNQDDSSGV